MMKRDIRDLFKENELENHSLPKTHRGDFVKKIERFNRNKTKRFNRKKMKIVAVIILFLGASIFMFKNDDQVLNKQPQLTIEEQIQSLEKEYLAQIDNEWQNVQRLVKDEKLKQRYDEKLNALSDEYKNISKAFNLNSNDINTIERLIKNLKKRLSLLKEIQEHIKILNQKNEQNEYTI